MALQLPTPEQLTDYEENGLSESAALQQAADLFTLATGVQDTPSDPLAQRILTDAILQMAWALRTRHDDMEAEFSPFQSERIGSYSYSKMQQSVVAGHATGVPLFDQAVSWFNSKNSVGTASTSSENVFKPGQPWAGESNRRHRHDPSSIVFKG